MDKNTMLELYTQFNKIQNQFTAIRRYLVTTDFEEPIYASEMQVLALVKDRSYTLKQIAESLYITNSAASQLVKKLCHKGFMLKTRNPENERETIITLSSKGLKAVDHFLSTETYTLGEIVSKFDHFNENEIGSIQFFLDTIEKMFDDKLQNQ